MNYKILALLFMLGAIFAGTKLAKSTIIPNVESWAEEIGANPRLYPDGPDRKNYKKFVKSIETICRSVIKHRKADFEESASYYGSSSNVNRSCTFRTWIVTPAFYFVMLYPDDKGAGYVVQFRCKNPEIIFAGDIKIGDPLAKAEQFFDLPRNIIDRVNNYPYIYNPNFDVGPVLLLDSEKNIKAITYTSDHSNIFGKIPLETDKFILYSVSL